ncbi:MAG: FAD-dependent oxidoreductase, partial [Syntrophales bacterium]|nr:FAD-dependent oxidoreductase [Syntrophales bacterium]
MKKIDAIIIGSGQGGVPLAVELSNQGKEVVIFERSRMGGSCINWGCTPSKAFLGAAHAAGRARHAEELGVYTHVTIDFPRVMERVRHVRDSFTQSSEKRLRKAGITIKFSEASFDSQGNVNSEDGQYNAPLVVIDTGSSPATPPIPDLDVEPFLTDRNFWELKELPQRTLVLGAGYIGLELGQGLARLGSKVQIIEKADRPMSQEDSDISAVLKEALENDGIEFHLDADIERVAYKWDLYRVY